MPSNLFDNITLKNLYQLAFTLSFLGIFIFIADWGFRQTDTWQRTINGYYLIVLFVGIAATIARYKTENRKLKTAVAVFDILTVFITIGIILNYFVGQLSFSFLYTDYKVKFAILLTFVREFGEFRLDYKRTVFNPAQLFIISFLVIIFGGALLLMLPNSTYQGISFLDALFTSTSAVCVTGLIVVDTATYFTHFGQTVILALIQIGGLGILTFASYFSYFFKGGSSYENQLVLSDMTSSQKLGEVFSTIKNILLITFFIEFSGAVFIFLSLDSSLFQNTSEKIYFSIFHSISAFCNAGFSTLSNGMYEEGFRFNYNLHLVLAVLIILGGLGFPIVINIISYCKQFIFRQILKLSFGEEKYQPWVLNLNSRITLITSIILIIGGTIGFYITEYNNSLTVHQGFGKFVTALFGAISPRTAGFNSVDMTTLNASTVLLIIFLMWIGAAPVSTGGGIKTSTFAIAVLNCFTLAKGKSKIEVYRREIADSSVRRAFATITLYFLVVGIGIFFISIFDPQQNLLGVAFECFSAHSTVGLTIGITASLSTGSKWVLIVLMFIGRVSMLSILIAIFKKVKHKNYRYPTEEITIN